jgi:hypothetical protein
MFLEQMLIHLLGLDLLAAVSARYRRIGLSHRGEDLSGPPVLLTSSGEREIVASVSDKYTS